MVERLSLDAIGPNQFDKFIDLLTEWISSGIVKIQLRVPEQLSFDFSEEKLSKALQANELPLATIRQLRYEIPFMMIGILSGYRNRVVSFLVDQARGPKVPESVQKPTKEQIRAEIAFRIQLIEDRLLSTELRREYAIKRSAKTSIYVDTSWDITEKRSDSGGRVLPGHVFATVRISAQKPSKQAHSEFTLPFSLDLSNLPETDALTLTMTAEDLKDIIGKLTKASDDLRQAGEAEGGR